jgi:hypothetical protein
MDSLIKVGDMKSIMLIICISIFSINSFAQKESAKNGAAIEWDKISYDFGDIYQGDKVEYTFHFTNNGIQPLIITNVEVTCGCTTPKGWPRDPIAPGESGDLTVAFNSTGKIGRQNKVITVTSNSVGTDNQVMFTANVLERKVVDNK